MISVRACDNVGVRRASAQFAITGSKYAGKSWPAARYSPAVAKTALYNDSGRMALFIVLSHLTAVNPFSASRARLLIGG
jgi:hypothetical protein